MFGSIRLRVTGAAAALLLCANVLSAQQASAAIQHPPPAPPAIPFEHGARVSTVFAGAPLDGPDGMAFDAAGRLVIANWGGGKGTTVVRMHPRDPSHHAVIGGFAAPDGVMLDITGDLLVSNFGDGTVARMDTAGHVTTVARGLGRPSGLVRAANGDVFVADFGNWDGTVVRRIRHDGAIDTLATGLGAPIGLALTPSGTLYISNFATGIVHAREPDGTRRVRARVANAPPAMLQFLALAPDGSLYVPSYGHNRVYRVSPAGHVSVVAGSGVRGNADGSGERAQFDGPNSVAISADGRTLWVTEYNANRLRRIELSPARTRSR